MSLEWAIVTETMLPLGGCSKVTLYKFEGKLTVAIVKETPTRRHKSNSSHFMMGSRVTRGSYFVLSLSLSALPFEQLKH